MKAFLPACLLVSTSRIPAFNCFPLRHRWSSCYIFIDSKILCQNILQQSWTN
ncbi:hypothetical protein BX666DRAFT_1942136, partial [Dichotomocladium elegans]